MLAYRRDEVRDLNAAGRALMDQAGRLGHDRLVLAGGEFAVGDECPPPPLVVFSLYWFSFRIARAHQAVVCRDILGILATNPSSARRSYANPTAADRARRRA